MAAYLTLHMMPERPLIGSLQDSDQLWRLSPPARSALQVVLAEPAAALSMSWSITRTAPLASGKGGPECAADVTITLAGESRQRLMEVRPSCNAGIFDPSLQGLLAGLASRACSACFNPSWVPAGHDAARLIAAEIGGTAGAVPRCGAALSADPAV